MKFKKKIKTRVKEFREELRLTQQELADLVGVSRQTIYYLEKGDYNPSLTLSFKISEVLDKPLNEIFFRVPVIKDKIESLSLKELKSISKQLEISYERLVSLTEMSEEELNENFSVKQLKDISEVLDMDLEDVFQ
jgi:putative transcriptional regulator